MTHIVIIPFDIASKFYPSLELARRLQTAGHQITFVGKLDLQDRVESAGFQFVTHYTGEKLRTPKIKTPVQWLKGMLTINQRMEYAIEALGMGQFLGVLEKLNPDLLLIDIESHGFIIAAQPTGIPIALLSTFISTEKQSGIPPLQLPITPGKGWFGSPMGIEWAWFRYRVWKLFRLMWKWLREAGVDKTTVLRRYARQTGFSFADEVDYFQWLLPFSYRHLPILSLNAVELDFPHEPHPRVHYVGPMIAEKQENPFANMTDDDAARLQAVLNRHNDNKGNRNLIYCAFGAFFSGDDTTFWHKLADAVAMHDEWDVIFALGGRLDTDKLGNLPANVHAFKWVPQSHVLAYADCAVIHGGITSVNECIQFGVPMVIYPFDTVDQHGDAMRVAYHGVGIAGNRNTDDSKIIRQHVEKALTEADFTVNITHIRQHFEDYKQEKILHNVIELLSKKTLKFS